MNEDLWVFGYGSLLWNPGFEYVEHQIAVLPDHHRSFCMHSIHYRGTAEAPGLVLALDAVSGAECSGVGFRIAAKKSADTLQYLRDRELISSAYIEQWHDITFLDGRIVSAVCYVIDSTHDQYAGGISLRNQAAIISRAVGSAGPNVEYLLNTVAQLDELGIVDADMSALSKMVGRAD